MPLGVCCCKTVVQFGLHSGGKSTHHPTSQGLAPWLSVPHLAVFAHHCLHRLPLLSGVWQPSSDVPLGMHSSPIISPLTQQNWLLPQKTRAQGLGPCLHTTPEDTFTLCPFAWTHRKTCPLQTPARNREVPGSPTSLAKALLLSFFLSFFFWKQWPIFPHYWAGNAEHRNCDGLTTMRQTATMWSCVCRSWKWPSPLIAWGHLKPFAAAYYH